MSSRMNFSGSFERFLKGDLDPGNIFGFNPSRAELRANKADRSRRASQIAAEQSSDAIRKAGGSTDAPTKQVAKLGSKTHFAALSPLTPVPLPSVTISAAATEAAKNKGDNSKAKKKLAASNKKHADTALTVENLNKATRFSSGRVHRSILGDARG